MIRRKGPILAAAVIAAFALGWYRGLFGVDQIAPPATSPGGPTVSGEVGEGGAPSVRQGSVSNSASVGSASSPAASVVPPGASAQPPIQETSASPDGPKTPAAPAFDIVRVDPDGSTVVAGKGAANETIALTNGTQTFGEARTNANGDFVMTLSLPTGSHRLQLAQGGDVVSSDAAVVNVPAKDKPDELLVMMQRPGEASEILQRPEEPPAAQAAHRPEGAPAELQQADRNAELASASPTVPATEASPAAQPRAESLSVEAVEIEGDRLFVAGSAKDRSTVRVYLDDQSIAETESGAGDRFIASARTDVAVGDHTVRADVVDERGQVIERVEVPFRRPEGSTMAAVAALPPSAPDAGSPAAPGATVATVPSAPEQSPGKGGPASASRAAGNVATDASGAAAGLGEPEIVRQPALQASASRVIIRRGDTLWRISRTTYGRGSRYTVIYLANGDQIRDPNRIYPGQVFRMPDGDEPDAQPRG